MKAGSAGTLWTNALLVAMPSLSFSALVAIAVLPWNLPAQSALLLQLLPTIAIFYWTNDAKRALPSPLLAAGGLMIDVATFGPLGFWAAVYLAAQVCSSALPVRDIATPTRRVAAFFALTLLLSALQWAAMSVYLVTIADWRPLAVAGVIVSVVYAVVCLVSAVVRTSPIRPRVRPAP